MQTTTFYWIIAVVMFIIFTFVKYPLAYIKLILQLADDLISVYNKVIERGQSRLAKQDAERILNIIEGEDETVDQNYIKKCKSFVNQIIELETDEVDIGDLSYKKKREILSTHFLELYKEINKDEYMDYEEWTKNILKK